MAHAGACPRRLATGVVLGAGSSCPQAICLSTLRHPSSPIRRRRSLASACCTVPRKAAATEGQRAGRSISTRRVRRADSPVTGGLRPADSRGPLHLRGQGPGADRRPCAPLQRCLCLRASGGQQRVRRGARAGNGSRGRPNGGANTLTTDQHPSRSCPRADRRSSRAGGDRRPSIPRTRTAQRAPASTTGTPPSSPA